MGSVAYPAGVVGGETPAHPEDETGRVQACRCQAVSLAGRTGVYSALTCLRSPSYCVRGERVRSTSSRWRLRHSLALHRTDCGENRRDRLVRVSLYLSSTRLIYWSVPMSDFEVVRRLLARPSLTTLSPAHSASLCIVTHTDTLQPLS